MFSMRFVYLVATIAVVTVGSNPVLSGVIGKRIARQASVFGFAKDDNNEYSYILYFKFVS